EVLVEALKHLRQLTLLSPPGPVHVPNQPLVGAMEELAAALDTRQPDHGEASAAIGPRDVLEAEELESIWLLTVLRASLGGKPAKEQQPSFLLGQFQVKSCEALAQLLFKVFGVCQILEGHHEVIDEAYEVRLALALRLELPLEPQVQRKMQIDVGKDAGDRTTLWSSLL